MVDRNKAAMVAIAGDATDVDPVVRDFAATANISRVTASRILTDARARGLGAEEAIREYLGNTANRPALLRAGSSNLGADDRT